MIRTMILLSAVSMLLIGCCLQQDEEELKPTEMCVWAENVIREGIMYALPEGKSSVFTSCNNGVEVIIYCDDMKMYCEATQNEYTYLIVNGQEFVLNTFGEPFYLREAVSPRIIWYDWNHDGVEDFVLWAENDRAGYLQYAFVSTGEEQFRNLGSAGWKTDGTLCSYQRIPYKVTLLDDYKIKIELSSADISKIYDIRNSDFLERCAIPLGMYDEEGKITETGRNWDFDNAGLYEKSISCSISNDGSLNMSIVSWIGSGYSTYDLDYGFIFNWKITETGYELRNIESFGN